VSRHRICSLQSHSNRPDQSVAGREWRTLCQSHNPELAYGDGSHWASQQGTIRSFMPLGKDRAIAGEACPAPQGTSFEGLRIAEWHRIYDEGH
jgi:hypothetical protein